MCSRQTKALLLFIWAIMLSACSTTPPEGIEPVTPFDVKKYVGTWYEIARLDHSFERGLTDVSAQYSIEPDGSLKVINRGFSQRLDDWKTATGHALFTGATNRGSLKVSFFGPFYGGYHIVALDQENYQWAMIAGPDRDYLWILARDKKLDANILESLLAQASKLGYDTSKLIWVEHLR